MGLRKWVKNKIHSGNGLFVWDHSESSKSTIVEKTGDGLWKITVRGPKNGVHWAYNGTVKSKDRAIEIAKNRMRES